MNLIICPSGLSAPCRGSDRLILPSLAGLIEEGGLGPVERGTAVVNQRRRKIDYDSFWLCDPLKGFGLFNLEVVMQAGGLQQLPQATEGPEEIGDCLRSFPGRRTVSGVNVIDQSNR